MKRYMFLINQQLLNTTQNISYNVSLNSKNELNAAYNMVVDASTYNNIITSNLFNYSNVTNSSSSLSSNTNSVSEFVSNTNDLEVLLNSNLNVYLNLNNSLSSNSSDVKFSNYSSNIL